MSQDNLNPTKQPVLKVLGLGGGGSNAVNRMIELGLGGVEFIVANTDAQALKSSLAPTKIQLGPHITRGLGAGGKPIIGAKAALESRDTLREALEGADMVFLAAGMGGGTGTGSISIAAQVAKEVGAVTITVVTLPFSFEMGTRQKNAAQGIRALQPHTDTLIAIPNDRLLQIAPEDLPLDVAFRLADDVLRQAVQGIAELVTAPGLINVDFAHIQAMMKRGGGALMTIGYGQGETKAFQAVQQALHHPLLDEIDLSSAAGVIANFSGGRELTLFDVSDALNNVREMAGTEIDIVLGLSNDARLEDRAQVILVITGLGATSLEEIIPGISAKRQPIRQPEVPQALLEDVPEANPQYEDEDYPPIPAEIPFAQEPELVSAIQDLDLPAFMRRRRRFDQAEH